MWSSEEAMGWRLKFYLWIYSFFLCLCLSSEAEKIHGVTKIMQELDETDPETLKSYTV